MAMAMAMDMEMVIFGAPTSGWVGCFLELPRLVYSPGLHRKGSWPHMLSHWRRLGHQKATRGAPMSSRGAPKRFPRGSLEVLWEFFVSEEAPRNPPKP